MCIVTIMKIFVLLFFCALGIDAQNRTNPMVQTTNGVYRGSILKTQLGKDYYSFRGIRYAEAPTDSNRFKPTILAKPHDGIFDATEDGPVCPQPNSGSRVLSEDCLRINVHTTALPNNLYQPNRPVIVFIHPGIFTISSGASYEVGPMRLLDHDVVFVSFNYRLGALGFLSTGDSRAPGNVGLKDQVLALRWVQQNIKNFGGNPNSVTLMGHSAGSQSITLHIVSPMSKGLFHRAFTMSGAATTQLPIPIADQRDLAKKQAEFLNCPTDTFDKMFNCLYEKSPEEYSHSVEKLAVFERSPFVWTPVIEQEYSGNNDDVGPFLTGQPENLIREGKANFVPFYTGANVDEWGFLVIPAEEQAQNGNNTLYDEWNNNWEELAPSYFGYEMGTPRSSQISSELKSFYLHNEPLKAGRYQRLATLYADSLTFFQVHRFERLMATYSPYPVWYYQYYYENCDTLATWANGTRFGIVHYDEKHLIIQLADRPGLCPRDFKRVEEIWDLILNFARTGDPMPGHESDKYSAKWLPSTKDNPRYLEYRGEKMKMISGVIYQERMNKWDELFPMI